VNTSLDDQSKSNQSSASSSSSSSVSPESNSVQKETPQSSFISISGCPSSYDNSQQSRSLAQSAPLAINNQRPFPVTTAGSPSPPNSGMITPGLLSSPSLNPTSSTQRIEQAQSPQLQQLPWNAAAAAVAATTMSPTTPRRNNNNLTTMSPTTTPRHQSNNSQHNSCQTLPLGSVPIACSSASSQQSASSLSFSSSPSSETTGSPQTGTPVKPPSSAFLLGRIKFS